DRLDLTRPEIAVEPVVHGGNGFQLYRQFGQLVHHFLDVPVRQAGIGDDDFLDLVPSDERFVHLACVEHLDPGDAVPDIVFGMVDKAHDAGDHFGSVGQGVEGQQAGLVRAVNQYPASPLFAEYVMLIKCFVKDAQEDQRDGVEQEVGDHDMERDRQIERFREHPESQRQGRQNNGYYQSTVKNADGVPETRMPDYPAVRPRQYEYAQCGERHLGQEGNDVGDPIQGQLVADDVRHDKGVHGHVQIYDQDDPAGRLSFKNDLQIFSHDQIKG